MNMKTTKTALGAAAMLLCLAAAGRAKVGLSSQFINVVLENLKPGRSYNLRELKGIPYTVKNRGDSPVEVVLEVVPPEPKEMVAPYEAIPDPGWLQLSPSRAILGPGEPAFSDLTIKVPDDPKYIGRHFHGVIWAHTMNTGFMAAGVKSNVRFSIGKGPETLAEEERQKQMVELNYELWPSALYVLQAKAGSYDVKKQEKKSLKLTNRDDKELVLTVKAVPWSGSKPEGYETPEDVSWAKFVPDTVTVDAESLKDIKLMLDVPESLKGKKVAFLVQLALPIGTVVNMSNRVYVQIE
ncbi:MAG: hypothetical protein HYV14_17910 [Elusimicrobia bacterium]|nr:hypothetical protein [Elusimicrobiota bacterium]